jgi:hypothetical protein
VTSLADFRTPIERGERMVRAPQPSAAKKLKPRMWVVERMPRMKWVTAAQVAALCGVSRPNIHPHLFYARKVGALKHKRDGECSCCGKPVVLWWRP